MMPPCGMPPPPGGGPGGFGPKIVGAEHREGTMNTANAEHQKVKSDPYAGDVKFSSPFEFSAGEASAGAGPEAQGFVATAVVASIAASVAPAPPYPVPQVGVRVSGYQQSQATVAVYSQAPSPPPMQQYPPPGYMPPPSQPQQLAGPPPAVRPVLEGWLAKRGHEFGKSWNSRWFVLHACGVLTYGKSAKDQDDRQIPLGPNTVARPLGHPEASGQAKVMAPKKPFAFEIYQGPGARVWYLDAGSAEKRDLWLRTILEVVAQMRASVPNSAFLGAGGPPVFAPGYGGPC